MHFHSTHQDLVCILFLRGGGGSQCPLSTRLRVLKYAHRVRSQFSSAEPTNVNSQNLLRIEI
jgi:hypothetical protein